MVKIVLLGSCRFSPYEILAKPDPLNPAYTVEEHHVFNNEEEYLNACKIFYPAMDDSELIIVYAPDGIGEHTMRDLNYGLHDSSGSDKRRFIVITGDGVYEI